MCVAKSYFMYHKVTSMIMSHLEAHAGFFRLSMKGKFGVYNKHKNKMHCRALQTLGVQLISA